MGFVFQSYNLVPTLTAAENVMLALDLRGTDLTKAPAIALDALKQGGPRRIAPMPFRARSAAARSSASPSRARWRARPSVILADEPTAALDSENGKAVMALLSEVAKDKGRGILVVTHDHRTLSYADRLIRIEDGKIVGRARRRARSNGAGAAAA